MKEWALIFLSSLVFSGCFVFDELDAGDAILDQHGAGTRRAREKAEAAAAAEAEAAKPVVRRGAEEPGVQEKLSKWWQEVSKEGPAPPDPNDGIVKCDFGGKIRFARKKDCEIRGGRAQDVPASQRFTRMPDPPVQAKTDAPPNQ